jgi:hypothetical protein
MLKNSLLVIIGWETGVLIAPVQSLKGPLFHPEVIKLFALISSFPVFGAPSLVWSALGTAPVLHQLL